MSETKTKRNLFFSKKKSLKLQKRILNQAYLGIDQKKEILALRQRISKKYCVCRLRHGNKIRSLGAQKS